MDLRPVRAGAILGALLLVATALVGCAGEPEPRVQHVAFCPAPDPDDPGRTRVDVEFRQGEVVVAEASVAVGMAVTVEVPVGAISIWAGGVEQGGAVGGAESGSVDDESYTPPAPTDMIYLSGGEGCPDVAAPYGAD